MGTSNVPKTFGTPCSVRLSILANTNYFIVAITPDLYNKRHILHFVILSNCIYSNLGQLNISQLFHERGWKICVFH